MNTQQHTYRPGSRFLSSLKLAIPISLFLWFCIILIGKNLLLVLHW